jgi:Coenzyme PQQ synthesis protein D (PqqD)
MPSPRRADLNLLDLVPARMAEWDEREEAVVVRRPRPRAPWYLLPLEWLRFGLAVRRIRLDRVGSAAWRACDGRRTVGEIADLLRDRFGNAVEPAEERLGMLVRRLQREGLLIYRSARLGSEEPLTGLAPHVERLLT